MLKRIALIAIICILSVTLNVYAGVTEVILNASAKEVKVGETVTIKLSAKNGTGIEGIDSVLDYDKTKLELTNASTLAAENYMSMSDTNDATGKFQLSVMYTGSGNAPQIADVATLIFKVLEEADTNEILTIKLSDIEVGGSDDDWTELEDQTITIKALRDEEQEPGDDQGSTGGSQTPGDDNQDPTPDDGKDDSTADGDYGYAGLEDYVFVLVLGAIVLAVVLYKKSNKYRDI